MKFAPLKPVSYHLKMSFQSELDLQKFDSNKEEGPFFWLFSNNTAKNVQKKLGKLGFVKELDEKKEVQNVYDSKGREHIVFRFDVKKSGIPGGFEQGGYGWFRDFLGREVKSRLSSSETGHFVLSQFGLDDKEQSGVGAAIELAGYSFKKQFDGDNYGFFNKETKATSKYLKKISFKDFNKKALMSGVHSGFGVNISRHLVNLPPNFCHPTMLSEFCESQFNEGSFKTQVIKGSSLVKKGFGLLHAVGKAAEHGPALIHISYRPENDKTRKTKSKKSTSKKPVLFVGKGITFDSGGLDLKPPAGMRKMKKDMGGASVVLALAAQFKLVQPNQPADFFVAAAENAVASNAFRPSDIIKSYSGRLIEIDNTDAEGRLVLADAISYAQEKVPDAGYLINCATLTGAIKYGLGGEVAGLFSNQNKLIESIFESSVEMDDPTWPMPIPHWSFSRLKSQTAECVNSAAGFGGALVAASFLKSFVHKDQAWAHIDLYSWTDRDQGPISAQEGNGGVVQALWNWVQKN